MTTFITRFDPPPGNGPRLAVKDLIDVEGVPTTAGCRAVADSAEPAKADAPCVVTAREQGARIVGKVNLHELAYGATGVNPWFGTPTNPLDERLVPGGSSSGSAVAVATDEADVAFGTDTGGSVRIPSACCGTAGLKTTWGRISCEGVWPLSHSLDTLGPMARDVAGLVVGMRLLEPGFAVDPIPPRRVGRIRGIEADPVVDQAIDDALAAAGFEVVDVDLPGWLPAQGAAAQILIREARDTLDDLLRTSSREGIGDDVLTMLDIGHTVDDDALAGARRAQGAWQGELARAFDRVELLALPTLSGFPTTIDDADAMAGRILTLPANLAGVPALALPVPTERGKGRLPASLQLIGPAHGEESLLAAGLVVEQAR